MQGCAPGRASLAAGDGARSASGAPRRPGPGRRRGASRTRGCSAATAPPRRRARGARGPARPCRRGDACTTRSCRVGEAAARIRWEAAMLIILRPTTASMKPAGFIADFAHEVLAEVNWRRAQPRRLGDGGLERLGGHTRHGRRGRDHERRCTRHLRVDEGDSEAEHFYFVPRLADSVHSALPPTSRRALSLLRCTKRARRSSVNPACNVSEPQVSPPPTRSGVASECA